jgi:hypothetical protein
VVVPFWYETLEFKGKSLLEEILRYADEIVVMAYRDNFPEAIKLSAEEVYVSKTYGKDVLIGFELHPQKDELHRVYRVDKDRLTLIGSYRVVGKKLTMDLSTLKKVRNLRCENIRGFVIHSFRVF